MITVVYRLRIGLRDSDFESNLEQLIHLHIQVIYNYAELGICPSRSCYPFVFCVAARNTNAFTTVSSPSGTTDSNSVFRFLFLFCFSTFFSYLLILLLLLLLLFLLLLFVIFVLMRDWEVGGSRTETRGLRGFCFLFFLVCLFHLCIRQAEYGLCPKRNLSQEGNHSA